MYLANRLQGDPGVLKTRCAAAIYPVKIPEIPTPETGPLTSHPQQEAAMPAVSPTRVSFPLRTRLFIASIALLTLAGCAAQQPTQQRMQESTLTDAQAQAQGRATSRAPTQLQLGFGENAPRQAQAAPTEAEQADKAAINTQALPIREARTFLGTLPCLLGGSCEAARTTLTLAPNGQWRARSEPLTAAGATTGSAQQGCWEVTGIEPWRIRLRTAESESSMASFTFVNDNMLRVNSVNDHQPMLEYHLTRQADVDGIDELNAAKVPVCK